MEANKTPAELVGLIDRLCHVCPKGHYSRCCPFPLLAGLTSRSRQSLLSELGEARTLKLFDLATDCACSLDPRGPEKEGT